MTPQSWYRHIIRLHSLGCLIELSLHFGLLVLFLSQLNLFFPPEFQRTWAMAALVILGHGFWRSQTVWRPQQRWSHFKACDPQGWALMLRDLATEKGHYPNLELQQRACTEAEQWTKPTFPLWKIWKNGLFSLLISGLLLALAWSSDGIPQLQWSFGPHPTTTLTPPSYLELPSRQLHPEETAIQIYPGSLLHWEGLDSKERLKDTQGRNYLPLQNGEFKIYEARVLEALTFQLGEKDLLKVELLEDQIPRVEWLGNPNPIGLEALLLSFSAQDDHGLNETLITVNGREIEYAGKPSNKKLFSYRWEFNPRDHLNLMGGNISLQISAYDNDRIKGPKVGCSPAIVWEFPGIAPLSRQALDTLEQLKSHSEKRLQDQPNTSAPEIALKLQLLQIELSDNPAVPPQALQMLMSMSQQYQPHAQNNLPLAPPDEKAQLQRNLDLLQGLENNLEQIIQTVETAQLVQKMTELAKNLKNGQDASGQFPELYKELEKHLQKSPFPDQLSDQILQKFREAELSANMGDAKGAAEILEQMAEFMKQTSSQASGQSGENPMAQKFQKLLQDLQQLITLQQVNQSMLNLDNASVSPAIASEAQSMRSELRKSPALNRYQNIIQQLRRPQLSSLEQTKLMQELTQPDGSAYRGRDLQQLDQQLNRLTAGFGLTRPFEDFLPQLNSESKTLQDLSRNLLKSLNEQKKSNLPPELIQQQKDLGAEGLDFSKNFRLDFEPLIPEPGLYRLADLAAQAAQRAHLQMSALPEQAKSFMEQATFNWTMLQQQLQKLQEQAQRPSPQRLTIGSDGQLQLQPQNQNGQRQDGDGEWQNKDENLDIALPEDFKNTHDIEEQLRQQLKNAPNEKLRNSFQNYMMDLLE
jgi:hypothetical protein